MRPLSLANLANKPVLIAELQTPSPPVAMPRAEEITVTRSRELSNRMRELQKCKTNGRKQSCRIPGGKRNQKIAAAALLIPGPAETFVGLT